MSAVPSSALPLLQSAVYDGVDIGLRFRYIAPAARSISAVLMQEPWRGRYIGAPDHPYRSHWRLRTDYVEAEVDAIIEALREATGTAGHAIADTRATFLKVCRAAMVAPVPTAFVHGFAGRIYPVDDHVVFTGSYHPSAVAICKGLRGVWMPLIPGWKVPCSALLLHDTLRREMALTDSQAQAVVIMEGHYQFSDTAADDKLGLIKLPDADPSEDSPGDDEPLAVDSRAMLASVPALATSTLPDEVRSIDLSTFGLYGYQEEGVHFLLRMTSALLGDEPGLGKTRQSIVAAGIIARHTGLAVLIAAPASLLSNWEAEIRTIFPADTIAVRRAGTGAKWVVTNYEQLGAQQSEASRFGIFIADEAHALKEVSSLRTRIAFDVASLIPVRYLLTGTPILNREHEIHTLLRLSGHPLGNLELVDFLAQYAGSPVFRRALNIALADWMLRRKKNLVLRHLKGRQEQVVPLEMTQEQQAQYDAIFNDRSLRGLQKITRLRQFVETVKVDMLTEYALGLDGGSKILLFCEYVDTVSVLQERLSSLSPVTMVGSDSITKRRKAEGALREDPNTRAFIGTTMCAGVGLNLQAASYVGFAGLPWTPAQRDQAESRADRNGQTRLVICMIPLLKGTIDEVLWEMHKAKQAIMDEAIDGEQDEEAAMRMLATAIAA